MNLYVEITICGTATDTLLLASPTETLFNLEVNINAQTGGEGGEEGGETAGVAPEFNGFVEFIDWESGEFAFDSRYNIIGMTLNGNVGDTIVIYFGCDNEGPFDLTGYEIAFANGSHLVEFAADQEQYHSTKWDAMNLYVEITICGTASDTLLLAGPSDILFSLEVNINA